MTTSSERQSQIKTKLLAGNHPVSASAFARELHVSRQTIVGDVALMRARGEKIIALPRGYAYEQPSTQTAILVCKHMAADAKDELLRIVKLGGVVKDVEIDHPLYGQLRGTLELETENDVNQFINKMEDNHGQLLSSLTDGVHTHTVGYETADQLEQIKESLRSAWYLYE
ncbi:transcription repressor NadR [Lacticaseibacillus pabuli]|uniref:Transcription repressor NadR n=1 Tax=Lacticaseibacillus pabuli TaxID=3025672 RepID=A0ABY7WQS7_9LACO|nr:transcription repressor NadR [Lacticaseibacillus sp. KACC 23028]WDF82542.1 transcription repressor NadR [Lacticaseibacillus sp. KACC 23028]